MTEAAPELDFLRGGADASQLTRLTDRLAGQAAERGLLDVGHLSIDSPVGPLLLAATERGLIRVVYEAAGHDAALAQLAQQVGPRLLRAPQRLAAAARQLGEYFEGRRDVFDLDLDLALLGGFRGEVVRLLPRIGYGTTLSYTRLAELAGRPRAVRAAATACATNPLPIVLPCHRVVRSDGSAGEYAGGQAAKVFLLGLESSR